MVDHGGVGINQREVELLLRHGAELPRLPLRL
jgi:hypothetical protein